MTFSKSFNKLLTWFTCWNAALVFVSDVLCNLCFSSTTPTVSKLFVSGSRCFRDSPGNAYTSGKSYTILGLPTFWPHDYKCNCVDQTCNNMLFRPFDIQALCFLLMIFPGSSLRQFLSLMRNWFYYYLQETSYWIKEKYIYWQYSREKQWVMLSSKH